MALSSADKTVIATASAQYIETTLAQLASYFSSGGWLGSHNRYRRDCVAALQAASASSSVSHLDLTEYIAASSVIHCADGWGYLGRALGSHSRGDGCISAHLGYYAELRAALSILASQGIGVFNTKHFVVDSVGNCQQIPNTSGTHQMLWWILEHWAQQQSSARVLGKVVSPSGITLEDWMLEFGGIASLHLIGRDLLQQWGLDLRRMSRGDERRARNFLSYQPTSITPRPSLSAERTAKFMIDVWSLCRPSIFSRFENLDSHLLRTSLYKIYQSAMTAGQTGASASTGYRTRIQRTVANLSLASQIERQRIETFLTTTPTALPLLLRSAAGTVTPEDPEHHIQVMARAVLLLRLATGMAARSLRTASISALDLDFWWRSIGEQRGLWRTGEDPTDVMDLWNDVELAVDDADTWATTHSDPAVTIAQWCDEQAAAISTLQGCERIALWGLGL